MPSIIDVMQDANGWLYLYSIAINELPGGRASVHDVWARIQALDPCLWHGARCAQPFLWHGSQLIGGKPPGPSSTHL